MSARLDLENLNLALLKGRSVLILGGGSGLGLTTALEIAKTGARVTIADTLTHSVVVEPFASQNLAVQYVRCNVTNWQQQVVAFKQALTFAPSRSLDVVCSFVALNTQTDLVSEANDVQPRVDQDPDETDLHGFDMNLRGVFDSTRLALHYFKIPPRSTVIKKVRSRLSSSSSSSRSSSRSRSPSRSPSRSNSPVPPPPPPPLVPDAEVKEPTEAEQESKEGAVKPEIEPEPELRFTKTLIIVTDLSAYLDDPHNTLGTTSGFALRGLFRSLRTKAEKNLQVRVNLVAPWAVNTPAMKPILEKLEEQGVISREKLEPSANEASPAPIINGSTESKEPETEVQITNVAGDQSKAHENGIQAGDVATTVTEGQAQQDPIQSTSTPDQPELSAPGTASEQPETIDATETAEQTESNDAPSAAEHAETSDATAASNQQDTNEPASAPEQPVETNGTTAQAQENDSVEVKEATSAETSAKEDVEPEVPTISEPEVKYKNIEFTALVDVANTVVRLCIDSKLSGRAIAVMPEGAFDLEDDHEGGYAGEQLKRLLDIRKQAGDVWLSQSPDTRASQTVSVAESASAPEPEPASAVASVPATQHVEE